MEGMLMVEFVVIFIVMFVAFMFYIFFFRIDWETHIEMTEKQGVDYGWGSFADFKREFDKYEWDSRGWKESGWDRENNSEFHASIVVFNGKGMLLKSPIDWYKASSYAKNHIKSKIVDNRVRNYDWSK